MLKKRIRRAKKCGKLLSLLLSKQLFTEKYNDVLKDQDMLFEQLENAKSKVYNIELSCNYLIGHSTNDTISEININISDEVSILGSDDNSQISFCK